MATVMCERYDRSENEGIQGDGFEVRVVKTWRPPRVVGLSDKNILNSCRGLKELGESGLLRDAVTIDLSGNVFDSFSEALGVAAVAPSLKNLDLSRNSYLTDAKWSDTIELPLHLRSLALNLCGIGWDAVFGVSAAAKGLAELSVCGNDRLAEVPAVSGCVSTSLKKLVLSDCGIVSMDLVNSVAKAYPDLEELVLDGNGIVLGDCGICGSVKSLSLARNGLEDLDAVLDCVKRTFPNVTNLRLNGNPMCEKMSVTSTRVKALMAIPTLQVFNGSEFSDSEKKDAVSGEKKTFVTADVAARTFESVSFKCELSEAKRDSYTVKLPLSLNVSVVKDIVVAMFGLAKGSVKLFYFSGEEGCFADEMSDDSAPLFRYGITSEGFIKIDS